MEISCPLPSTFDEAQDSRIYRKITWRIMPLLLCCYLAAYLDRVNIGFAKLQMADQLGFSETAYGLGAGLFFIGYFFFEVPSNMILHKVGARVWIARIMVTWGVLSALFAFVSTPTQFYVLRFLLGVAEAGFAPGVLLYLTYWYPAQRRGKATALYFLAIPLSSVIGGPISGWIMEHLDQNHGFAGWQWLFLIEAIPAVALGIFTFFYLDDSVEKAKWLLPDEKSRIAAVLVNENVGKQHHGGIISFISDRRIWVLCASYFCCVMGIYAVGFWTPTLIRATHVTDTFVIGILTAITNFVAVIAIYLSGRYADKHGRRRLFYAVAMVIGALGLTASVLGPRDPVFTVIGLSVATSGILGATSLFWAMPAALLAGATAAAGIAFINCVGNLAGFFSPYLVGWINDQTHDPVWGMVTIAVFLIIGSVLALRLPAQLIDR